MRERYVELFNDSFERCSRDPEFLDRFYEIFMGTSDEVRDKFKNTDMQAQKNTLLYSLSYMMIAHSKPDVLKGIADRHNSSQLDIKPQLYALWLDSMVEAVRLTDPQTSERTEQAWRQVMQPGIDYMINRYENSGASRK